MSRSYDWMHVNKKIYQDLDSIFHAKENLPDLHAGKYCFLNGILYWKNCYNKGDYIGHLSISKKDTTLFYKLIFIHKDNNEERYSCTFESLILEQYSFDYILGEEVFDEDELLGKNYVIQTYWSSAFPLDEFIHSLHGKYDLGMNTPPYIIGTIFQKFRGVK